MDPGTTQLSQAETNRECREIDAAAQPAAAAEWSPWNPVEDRDLVCDTSQATVVPLPEAGQRIFVALDPAGTVQFDFDPAEAVRSTQFGDLVLDISGGEVVLRDYLDVLVAGNVPVLEGPNGVPIDPQSLLAEPAAGVQPAAGGLAGDTGGPIGPANEGHFFTNTPSPALLGGLDYAGVIDPTALSYRTPEPTFQLFPVLGGGDDDGNGGDGPSAGNDAETTLGNATTTNLVIVFDKSASMLRDPGVPGFATRLDLAQAAVAKLLATYADNGPINVLIVDFATAAATSGWLTGGDAATQGTSYVNGLTTSGGTNYLAAINTLQGTYPVGTPAADKSVVYFISDGEPAPPNTSLGTNGAVPAWESFLADNDIDTAFAIGLNNRRDELDRQALEDIAFPNNAGDKNPVLITDEGEIDDILIDTVPAPPVSGDVAANDDFGSAGAGFIVSIEVDGTTYTYDPVAQTVTGGGQTIAGSVLDVATDLGGNLTFDFADGTYSYAPPKVTTNETEVFTYTIQDAVGATDSATLTINVRRAQDRPPVTVPQTVLLPDDATQVPAEFAGTGFPLLLAAPSDLDGDELTIRITAIPAAGTVLNGSTPVAVGTELTVDQFRALRYQPDSDGTEESVTLTYAASDGVNTTGGSATINTVAGAPVTIAGGPADEVIFGTGGDDSLSSGDGTDRLFGGAGNDSMVGGAGTDQVVGGAGDDTLDGGDGDDSIAGGDGDDVIIPSLGNDIIEGAGGLDLLDCSDVGGAVTIDFNGGTISGAVSGSFRSIETVIGSDFNDTILGNANANPLNGGAGNDTINGRNGNDTLTGGEGQDRLDLSLGNDVARYLAASDSGDSVAGFDAVASGGQDVIDLVGLFDDLGVAAADRPGRVAFVDTGNNVDVRVDADGNAANGAELTVVTLLGVRSAGDLIVGEDVIVAA